MADDIPQWAKERACDLATKAATTTVLCLPTDGSVYLKAFARYIAEHEEPPVDPLLVEAREIVNRLIYSQIVRANHDWTELVNIAVAALRRGVELGKGGEP